VQLTDISAADLRSWCLRWLGSEPRTELFASGHLSRVIGIRLADGRDVVVKIRPAEPRQAACAAVHRHMWDAGFPCPQPLVGPVPFGDADATRGYAADAEALLTGGAPFPAAADPAADAARAAAFADLLASFIRLAPDCADVPSLHPTPAWMNWHHGGDEVWPAPDDRDDDLNAHPETAWLDELGRGVRDRLAAAKTAPPVIGHCDWESHNLDFRDGEPHAVHDWDSVVGEPETVIVGVAAAMWPAGAESAGATLDQTSAFLAAYQRSRGQDFTPPETEQTWAAGLWIRSFNAKKYLLDGLETLTRAEAAERARRAGL
jgi:hypothetical protein